MATNFELSGAYKRTEKGNVNYYFGAGGTGYDSLALAYAAIPTAVREGQHFGVWEMIEGQLKLVEYVWSTKGAIGDGDEESLGLAGGSSASIDDNYTGIDKTWSSQKITDLLFNKVDKEDNKGLSTNDYTDVDKAKVDGLVQVFLGSFTSLLQLQSAYPTGSDGQFAIVEPDRYNWNGSAWVLVPNASDNVFLQDFTVKLGSGKTFGKYLNDQTVPAAGKTANEVLLMAAIESVPPTYNSPSLGLSAGLTPSAPFEVGTSVAVTLTTSFNQADAGAPGVSSIKKNGSEISTATSTSDTIVTSLTPTTYNATRAYAQGPVKNDNLGNPYPTGQIASGTVTSNTISIVGAYKSFFGPASSVPTNSAQARALATTAVGVTPGTVINMNTGTSQLYMVICVSPGRSISSVIDVNNANTNITSDYVLVNNNFTVNDAAGNPVTGYTLYVKTMGVPYSSNTVHRITIA